MIKLKCFDETRGVRKQIQTLFTSHLFKLKLILYLKMLKKTNNHCENSNKSFVTSILLS